jgi:hypothetical protein
MGMPTYTPEELIAEARSEVCAKRYTAKETKALALQLADTLEKLSQPRVIETAQDVAQLEHNSVVLSKTGHPFTVALLLFSQGDMRRWAPVNNGTYAYTSDLAFIEGEGPVTVVYTAPVIGQEPDPKPWVSATGFRSAIQAYTPRHGLSRCQPRAENDRG